MDGLKEVLKKIIVPFLNYFMDGLVVITDFSNESNKNKITEKH